MNRQAKLIIGVLSVVCIALGGALLLRSGVLAAGDGGTDGGSVSGRRLAAGAAARPAAEAGAANERRDDRSWFERLTGSGPERVTVPAGTAVEVRLDHPLSSREMRAGDTFAVTLAHDLAVDGRRVGSAGSRGLARVVEIDHSDRVKGREWMRIDLTEIALGGEDLRVATAPVTLVARGTQKRDAAVIGGGAAIGALIGAVTGGGDGAAKGAAIGGAGGTGVVLATRGEDIDLPAGRALTFRLTEPVIATPERGRLASDDGRSPRR